MQVFDGTYIDDRGWQHFRVEGKTYDIRFHPNTLEWECSCPAYKFKRGNKTCKHIKQKHKLQIITKPIRQKLKPQLLFNITLFVKYYLNSLSKIFQMTSKRLKMIS